MEKMMMMGAMWTQMGSFMATIMLVYTIWEKLVPPPLRESLRTHSRKLSVIFSPFIRIKFPEFVGERLKRSEAFTCIQTYLSANSSQRATRLKAEEVKQSNTPIVFSMDDGEEISDEFQGLKFWWTSGKILTKTPTFSFYGASDKKRYYILTFHKSHRDVVTGSYINHILKEGKEIATRNRQLKLFSNNPSKNWYGYKRTKWSNVVFEHPASFDTLALDPKLKEEIKKDLEKFKNGKDYYAKNGKAWKRGYLLFGPPGTGKSTMVAAMANFMNYDIYDLELTAVKDNAELRKLLLDTSPKSIVVIEDIDCSLDLTGQRKKKENEGNEGPKDTIKKVVEDDDKPSKVTLSGLLNVIDGIWSACGGERIFVFTTNFVDKLDPALIRPGRMDKHIELSYCCYQAFELLAKNCLDIETHHLYDRIKDLFEEAKMTPAEVAENLMPKSVDEEVESCLKRLIEALEKAKKKNSEKTGEQVKENGFH